MVFCVSGNNRKKKFPVLKNIPIYKAGFILILLLLQVNLFCQDNSLEPKSTAFFDSLDNHIEVLQQQIPRLKQSHDISLFNVQRELDMALFIKSYEEYVVEENLFKAKDLVESRIERAKFRKDQYAVDFYNGYKDKVYNQIKYQRMHYQALFEKEKNFRKEFNAITKEETVDAYKRAQHMIGLALKYAEENNFTEAAKGLRNYSVFCEAKLFDLLSPYDLNELTQNEKNFEKVFLPLIESDSIATIKEAEKLVGYCIQYADFLKTPLNREYFEQQKLAVATAISDLLDKQGSVSGLRELTDQSLLARRDSLNPRGVYKWHETIIVISEFTPASGFENVKKGEAIINADNVLAAYLKKNKLCKSTEDLKFGYSYIIPYKSGNTASSFLYHPELQKWQYIACYTLINNPGYTREISRYMPPILFEDESQLKAE
jgi:hypothetical protein